MSTEKIIRQQAKDSLRSNWTNVIAAVLAFFAVVIALEGLLYIFCFQFKLVNIETGSINQNKQLFYYLAEIVVFVLFLFVSPVINGIIKMVYNTSALGKAEIYDMFFFFKKAGRYFKTVLFNFFLLALFSVLSFGLDVYGYLSMFFDKSLSDGFYFDGISFLLLGAYIISVVLKILIFFMFIHYPIIAYSMNMNVPYGKYFFGFVGFSARNLWATLKLFFSFIGWMALCFFVVPAFYVLPYLMTSMVTSAKWLFALEKDRGVVC